MFFNFQLTKIIFANKRTYCIFISANSSYDELDFLLKNDLEGKLIA